MARHGKSCIMHHAFSWFLNQWLDVTVTAPDRIEIKGGCTARTVLVDDRTGNRTFCRIVSCHDCY